MEIKITGHYESREENTTLFEYLLERVNNTTYGSGALEEVQDQAENAGAILGKLIEKLVEKEMLSLDDIADLVEDYTVVKIERSESA